MYLVIKIKSQVIGKFKIGLHIDNKNPKFNSLICRMTCIMHCKHLYKLSSLSLLQIVIFMNVECLLRLIQMNGFGASPSQP